jgi:hypothetical protein
MVSATDVHPRRGKSEEGSVFTVEIPLFVQNEQLA